MSEGQSRKFQVAATVIVKNETPYLDEWICYHAAIGVEHFFVFNNNSTDDLAGTLRRYVNHGLATLIEWPLTGGQVDAYNFAARFFGHAAEWMAFFDADEFIVPKRDPDLPSFLKRFPEADQVLVPWRNFGFSGHRTRPKGLVIENFRLARNIPEGGFREMLCKAIVRPRALLHAGVHNCRTRHGATVNGEGEKVPERHLLERPSYATIQINHYYTKSYEEFVAKIDRGQGDGDAEKKAYSFESQTDFTTLDEAALRFLAATRGKLREFHDLSPSPFRYGSRLKLADLPRANPFGWAATKAIANFLHRVPQIQKGFSPVENIAAKPAQATLVEAPAERDIAPGEFAASMHFKDFLRRIGAEAVWTLEARSLDGIRPIGATASLGAGGMTIEATETEPRLRFELGRVDRLRHYALLFAVRVPAAAELRFAAESPNPPPLAAPLAVPGPGVFIGIVEVTPIAARLAAVEAALAGTARSCHFLDLALVTFG